MSAKDIAQFTNLTIRGVETARYRIRKKLAIPGNINLPKIRKQSQWQSQLQ